jgi:hypothetical protein
MTAKTAKLFTSVGAKQAGDECENLELAGVFQQFT